MSSGGQIRWGGSQYMDSSYRMTPAMLRTRQKYFRRNFLTGLFLAGFVTSVYTYAATAGGADDFSDVPIPPIAEDQIENLKKDYGKSDQSK
ncbi:hypothetical protein V1511DRAFT_494123 [Dipodascopsis uninucleata]